MVVEQRQAEDRRRGARPGGTVQRLPGPDPRQGPRGRHPPERDLHLRHPRRVGAGQPRSRRRERRPRRASTTTGSTTWSIRAPWRSSAPTGPLHPAKIRYTEVLEPNNVRQCWSSYPFVDDQHMPVLEAVDGRGKAIVTLASVSQHAETLGFNGGTPQLDAQNNWVSSDWINFFRARSSASSAGWPSRWPAPSAPIESPEVYSRAISRIPQAVHRRLAPGRLPHAVQGRLGDRCGRYRARAGRLHRRDQGVRRRHGRVDRRRRCAPAPTATRRRTRSGASARASACLWTTSCSSSGPPWGCSRTGPATTATAPGRRRWRPTARRRAPR